MAAPRVFVSSTCFDLGEVRDNLVSFIKSYGFEEILSDKGDVFYHPDLHTHDSCVNEVQNCDLFILIIGGRFGGEYVADKQKSIVNAEYFAAKKLGVPVFCFVKNEVWANHRVYQENRNNKGVLDKIKFPAIEKQEHAESIFAFIDEVRKSPVNNGFFTFDFAREMQELLKKQWAGMFFDFLSKRKKQNEEKITNNLIANLTLASKKTEELVESLFKHLEPTRAELVIEELEKINRAREFFSSVFRYFEVDGFRNHNLEYIANLDTDVTWHKYLVSTGDFYYSEAYSDEYGSEICLSCEYSYYILSIGNDGEDLDFDDTTTYIEHSIRFDALKILTKDQMKKALDSYVGNSEKTFSF